MEPYERPVFDWLGAHIFIFYMLISWSVVAAVWWHFGRGSDD